VQLVAVMQDCQLVKDAAKATDVVIGRLGASIPWG